MALSPWQLGLLAVAGLFALLLLLYGVRRRGQLRLLLTLKARTLYRFHVRQRHHVPASGPALLVCNQLNYLEWLFIVLALKRPVRCLLLDAIVSDRLKRFLIRRAGAITLQGGNPDDVERALSEAAAALKAGQLVCIFCGRWRTASGEDLNLASVLRRLQERAPAPIVPLTVSQPWGSLFRLEKGSVRARPPVEVPHPVWVLFGEPLPASSDGGAVIQVVQRLSADCALMRNPHVLPAHRRFVRMASHHPLRPCLYDSNSRGPWLSYGKVLAGAMCLARCLKPLLADGKMVALWLPPGAGGALSNIALALLGKTSVNLNYTVGPDSIQSALRQCGIRHVLTARRFTSRVPLDVGPGVELIHLDDLLPKVTKGQKLRAFLKVLLLPRFVLEKWVLGLGNHRADGPATIIFSSGSTGEPKGVMLSHGNVMANVESMIQVINLAADDRFLCVLPFFHSFGYTVTLWAPLAAGASAVYHVDPRQAREIGELCKEHRCSIFLNTPTFLRFCLKKCEPEDFRSLRVLMCGAEKLPPAMAVDFQARFGVLPLEGYGCTELSPAAAANLPDIVFPAATRLTNKTGSIGPPLPGVSVRVIEPDSGTTLPIGQEGLLLVRGANVMQGYLHRPDLTESVCCGGEYCTGDMARLDEDGYVTLTGRLSRFAKIGGEMVPLERIEEELHGILETSERVLAVASVPDEKKGERLVVLHLGEMEVVATRLCRGLSERGLPNLWVPGERDFFPVQQLPVLGSGKLDLKRVKDLALLAVREG